MFHPGLGLGQHYHVDRHGQLTLKQSRLSVLNEMHTNSYTGPRLYVLIISFTVYLRVHDVVKLAVLT